MIKWVHKQFFCEDDSPTHMLAYYSVLVFGISVPLLTIIYIGW